MSGNQQILDLAGHVHTTLNAITFIADHVETISMEIRKPPFSQLGQQVDSERLGDRAVCIGCLADLAIHLMSEIETAVDACDPDEPSCSNQAGAA